MRSASPSEVLATLSVSDLRARDAEFREHPVAFASGIAAGGGIVVAAGHDLGVLEELCDRALRLERGSIASDGPFEDTAGPRPRSPAAAQ